MKQETTLCVTMNNAFVHPFSRATSYFSGSQGGWPRETVVVQPGQATILSQGQQNEIPTENPQGEHVNSPNRKELAEIQSGNHLAVR